MHEKPAAARIRRGGLWIFVVTPNLFLHRRLEETYFIAVGVGEFRHETHVPADRLFFARHFAAGLFKKVPRSIYLP